MRMTCQAVSKRVVHGLSVRPVMPPTAKARQETCSVSGAVDFHAAAGPLHREPPRAKGGFPRCLGRATGELNAKLAKSPLAGQRSRPLAFCSQTEAFLCV
jgi:hypothetical protein